MPNLVPANTDVPVNGQRSYYNGFINYGDPEVSSEGEWIRTFVFAGLTREGINTRYLDKLRERIFTPVMRELREAYGIAAPRTQEAKEAELELIWSLHASIFYIGMRKWVYGLPVPKDLDRHVERQVDAFLNGTPAVLQKLTSTAAKAAARVAK